jgi:hypothetical protein
MVTMAVRQAAAKAKPIEVLRIMTITSDEGPEQTPEKAFSFRTASHKNQWEGCGGNGGIRRRSVKTGRTNGIGWGGQRLFVFPHSIWSLQ